MAERRPKLRLVGAAERPPRPEPDRRRYVSVPVDARLWTELGFIALADGLTARERALVVAVVDGLLAARRA